MKQYILVSQVYHFTRFYIIFFEMVRQRVILQLKHIKTKKKEAKKEKVQNNRNTTTTINCFVSFSFFFLLNDTVKRQI